MIKHKISLIDLNLYEKELNNGLTVFLIPDNKGKSVMASFMTRYGSVHNQFVPIDSDEMITVPDGIAHFLEHKLFSEPDGTDAFHHFSELGVNANANTSNYRTSYLFRGNQNILESVAYLLDYVQRPYFTDESVLKEQGIIEQEINMYLDDPISFLSDVSFENAFVNDPLGRSVIGDVDSINSITKEILYKCYNSFYHPKNMYLIITGNFDKDEVLKVIENNQEAKVFDEFKEITFPKLSEPDNVLVERKIYEKNIVITKSLIGFKNRIIDMDIKLFRTYISYFFSIKFGGLSIFNEKLKNEGYINDDLGMSVTTGREHIYSRIFFESDKYDEVFKLIKDEIIKNEITKEDFDLVTKSSISNLVLSSEEISSVNYLILEDIAVYGEFNNDFKSFYGNLNYEDFMLVISKLDFSNDNEVILKSV